MAQVINTNISSLNAQRNLNNSQGALATSFQRLSTGLRINSAKDDAAGQAIVERFTTQINGLNQAVRNANDGISLAQTAEGAIAEVVNNLQRIRELAVQSANATNSSSDRAALDQEVQQRLDEIDRIASQTNFNGKKVLDGSFGNSIFQVGANVGDTVSVNLSQGVKSTQLGQIATATSTVEATIDALSGSGTIQVGANSAVTIGASVAGTQAGQTAGSAFAKAEAINSSGVAGLTVTATNNIEFTVADTSTGAGQTYSLAINGTDIFNTFDLSTGALTAAQIADSINAQSSNTGVNASLNGDDLRLSAADGRDIAIGEELGGGATGGLTAGAGGASTVNGIEYRDGQLGAFVNVTSGGTLTAADVNGGTLTFTASDNIIITGDGDDMGLASANFTIAKDSNTLSTTNVLTVNASNDIISRVDSALTDVNSIRAELGSVQNRFESIVVSLQSASENLSASRSRIQDADFAAETANLTKAQILQQAGITILSQANAQPQNVLALLQ